eukprot:CAMPEP_0172728174 /NCGR_PEP_ID=MMETSP1074-20121228/92093_1 /TAXON_ID=2916 /ORGANISM="Ceratium fusus, Strain PA161109" /LENGTH=320 /DNA_ID=CAMNT_0013555397 /DNA_START=91 /DNA_END=1053 /DNA_ORIENTATION=-
MTATVINYEEEDTFCYSPMRTPGRRRNAEDTGFNTPQRLFGSLPIPPTWPPMPLTPCAAVTPEVKKQSHMTPPSCPGAFQKKVQDDIEAALNKRSSTLLSLALLRGNSCGDSHGIFEAVRRQHLKALEFLLQSSGNGEVDRHCCGRRPLHLAIQVCAAEGDSGHQMAETLLHHGATPNFMAGDDPSVDAPLLDSTKRSSEAAVALLLSHGGDPCRTDAAGFSPLHIVCRHLPIYSAQERLIRLLLQHKACPVQVDKLGHTPGQWLRNRGNAWDLLKKSERICHRRTIIAAWGNGSKGSQVAPFGFGSLILEVLGSISQWL